jgi:hypothetical protein
VNLQRFRPDGLVEDAAEFGPVLAQMRAEASASNSVGLLFIFQFCALLYAFGSSSLL